MVNLWLENSSTATLSRWEWETGSIVRLDKYFKRSQYNHSTLYLHLAILLPYLLVTILSVKSTKKDLYRKELFAQKDIGLLAPIADFPQNNAQIRKLENGWYSYRYDSPRKSLQIFRHCLDPVKFLHAKLKVLPFCHFFLAIHRPAKWMHSDRDSNFYGAAEEI